MSYIADDHPISPTGKPHFASFDDDRCALCGLLFTKGERKTIKIDNLHVIVHEVCLIKYTPTQASNGPSSSRFYKDYAGLRAPCFYCGKPVEDIDISREHLVALSAGGTDDGLNLVLAHKKCNSIAGSHPVNYKIKLRERLLSLNIAAGDTP